MNIITNEQAREILKQILASPEFASKHLADNQFGKFLEELFVNFLSTLSGTKIDAVSVLLIIFLLIIGSIVVFYLVKNIAPYFGMMVKDVESKAKDAESQPAVLRSADLMGQAKKRANQGEYRLALRDIYLALLLEMTQRQWIAYEAAKTNRDYLKELNQRTEEKEHFRKIVNLFEYKWYGLEACTLEDYQMGLKLYGALLKDGSHG